MKLVQSPWYRKNWFPWGKTIGWHDEKFVSYRDEQDKVLAIITIRKHYCSPKGNPNGLPTSSLKFYVFVDCHNHIRRSRSFAEILAKAKRELDRQLFKEKSTRTRERKVDPCIKSP